MRSAQTIRTRLSNVVSRRSPRAGYGTPSDYTRYVFHRRLICIVFVMFGLIGSPGLASAGPIIVETEDAGGGGGVVQGGEFIDHVDGVPLAAQSTVNQRVAARLFIEYSYLAPAERIDPNVAPELCPPCREP